MKKNEKESSWQNCRLTQKNFWAKCLWSSRVGYHKPGYPNQRGKNGKVQKEPHKTLSGWTKTVLPRPNNRPSKAKSTTRSSPSLERIL
jgi:hypothetical protein